MKRKKLQLYKSTVIPEKVAEAFSSVLPIAIVVLLICLLFLPVKSGILLNFMSGTFLVIIGMGLFSLGADVGMTPIGEFVGSALLRTKKIWLIMPLLFVVGVLITIAEPDLQVLATLLSKSINQWILLLVVGAGVGVFLIIAFLKIILNIKLSIVLIVSYATVFVLSIFVPKSFMPLAFDAGGVTTGPMSVPFIIAIGTGMVSLRSDNKTSGEGFGLTALCSVGPIIAVMILGIIFKPEITVSETQLPDVEYTTSLVKGFLEELPSILWRVTLSLSPMLLLFVIFLFISKSLEKKAVIKIAVGVLYTFVGLVLFLDGVEAGFLPMGYYLGECIGESNYPYLAIPVGMILGWYIVSAEPAVHVLTKQVFEISNGAISKKSLRTSLMTGTALSIGLAFLRIICNIPIIYILVPVYAISLTLSFIVPEMFTAIAFDSGGVASGSMTASFMLPFSLGLCSAVGGDVALLGYGVVAFVAMTPPLTIQTLGLIYKVKLARNRKKTQEVTKVEKEEIIG